MEERKKRERERARASGPHGLALLGWVREEGGRGRGQRGTCAWVGQSEGEEKGKQSVLSILFFFFKNVK
jgi:hypothetical protein